MRCVDLKTNNNKSGNDDENTSASFSPVELKHRHFSPVSEGKFFKETLGSLKNWSAPALKLLIRERLMTLNAEELCNVVSVRHSDTCKQKMLLLIFCCCFC